MINSCLHWALALLSAQALLLGTDENLDERPLFDDLMAHSTEALIPKVKDNVVLDTKKIDIPGFPNAFNPSLIKTEGKILLIFRNQPEPNSRPFVSETGIVRLNEDLELISPPQLIVTRKPGDLTPQQSEDARLFLLNNELYITYNDNIGVVNPSEWERRDIFIAKLLEIDGQYIVEAPKKLYHFEKYESVRWQKNWQPFDWNGNLLIGYTINPHEILIPDPATGACYPVYKTTGDIDWHWGKLRGGALAQRCGDHYLAFFHSPTPIVSATSQGRELMHYFMGAYTFSAEPPFNLTNISPYPIFAENFYTESSLGIRCTYPGGFIIDGDYIYIAYGKDDHEIWIAIVDKDMLYANLKPVETISLDDDEDLEDEREESTPSDTPM